jgi:hypothetical protein
VATLSGMPRSSVGRSVVGEVLGEVLQFDSLVGSGVVSDGTQTWPFHCTQISGGSRTVPSGTPVRFDIAVGLPGVWEARDLRAPSGAFLCPACAAPVDGDEGSYDICSACGWEDDPVQRADPQARGANDRSLSDARDSIMRAVILSETGEAHPDARG